MAINKKQSTNCTCNLQCNEHHCTVHMQLDIITGVKNKSAYILVNHDHLVSAFFSFLISLMVFDSIGWREWIFEGISKLIECGESAAIYLGCCAEVLVLVLSEVGWCLFSQSRLGVHGLLTRSS